MKKALPLAIGLIFIATVGIVGYYLYCQSQKQEGAKETENEVEETGESPTDTAITGNVLIVIGSEDYNDKEYTDTRSAIEAANFEVTVASKGAKTAKGMNGTIVKVDIDIFDVKVDDYIAIAFIGGSGAHSYFYDNTALNLANEFYTSGKVTAAICSAPTILANAGLLDGKKATCYPGYEDYLTSGGATYTAEPVTVDGQIVTGNGPDAAKAFGEKIVELLENNWSGNI